jgi:hypothetical protein
MCNAISGALFDCGRESGTAKPPIPVIEIGGTSVTIGRNSSFYGVLTKCMVNCMGKPKKC